jgi:hypothetical protein
MRTERGTSTTDARWALVLVAVFVVGFLAFYAVLVFARGQIQKLDDDPTIHHYQGTTWVDDTCYVDEQGTLWCSARG